MRFLVPIIALAAILAGTAAFWLGVPVSNQELLANFAKARDFLTAAQSVGGLPWWSPMFMQGASLAPAWSFMVTNAVLLAFSIPLGFLAGPKIATLFCLFVGALGCFFLVRALVRNTAAPWLAAGLFLLNPSVLTRAAEFEHFVVVSSLALLPWAFLALHRFLESPFSKTAVLAGLAFAALTLAYSKTAVMALPAVLVFLLVSAIRSEIRPSPKWLALAALTFFVLAVVPNLPALRESRFMVLFELGPFDAWQSAFSTKSPISWIDRAGALTEGAEPGFAPTTARGGTYLGLLTFLVLAAILWRGDLHRSEEGRRGRLFLILALIMYWLSFGPRSVAGGQMAFLGMAGAIPDFTPALAWFLFIAQGWILFRLVPPDLPLRRVIGTLLCAVFFFVPGFRLIEWIPIYSDIRAPFDFFQVTGALCLVLATAILAPILWQAIPGGRMRTALAVAAIAATVVDVSPFAGGLYRGRLPAATFNEFLAAQDHLRHASGPGRVYAFSGRYFYLLTPYLSGRPLANEAFNNYLQLRGMARLQGMAFVSDEALTTFFRIGGTSHILIDKNDPDTPVDLQERLRKLLPVSFENASFVVLENRASTGRGFAAREFLTASTDDLTTAGRALEAAAHQVATIQVPGVAVSEPGFLGKIEDEAARSSRNLRDKGRAFEPVSTRTPGNYQLVEFSAMPDNGWLVFNESWHPDWRAFADGRELPIRRAFVAFSAVRAAAGEKVTFRFSPPVWYYLCAGISLLGWLAAVVFVLLPAGRRSLQTEAGE